MATTLTYQVDQGFMQGLETKLVTSNPTSLMVRCLSWGSDKKHGTARAARFRGPRTVKTYEVSEEAIGQYVSALHRLVRPSSRRQGEPTELSWLSGGSVAQLTRAGIQRNIVLLQLIDGSYLSVDPDCRLEFDPPRHASPENAPADDYTGGRTYDHNPVPAGCIPDLEVVRGQPSTEMGHPLALAIWAVADQSLRSQTPGEETVGNEGRVRLAMHGIAGNRWFRRPISTLLNSPDFRRIAYGTKSTYNRSRHSGFAAMGMQELCLSSKPFFVTCSCAINAQEIMPPFPPIGRSQDAVFGILVKYMYPDNLIAHLPFMVRHDLARPRPFTEADFREIGLDFGTISRLVIQHLIETALPVEGEAALRHMGERLVEVSHISHADWLNLTQELYLRNAAGEVRQLEELLDRYDEKPSYWAKDVHDYIDLVTRSGPDIANVHPQELRQTHSLEEAGVFQRSFLGSYGELMIAWPEIWQAARELKESGWTPQ